MHPSSQNILRGGIYPFQKITRKFDFRSACKKIPKTTAFLFILTLILGIFLYKINIFFFYVEFNSAKSNLPLQSGIYFFNSPFLFYGELRPEKAAPFKSCPYRFFFRNKYSSLASDSNQSRSEYPVHMQCRCTPSVQSIRTLPMESPLLPWRTNPQYWSSILHPLSDR